MVKIKINGKFFQCTYYVPCDLYNYLKSNVSHTFLKDGVLNFALSRLNHALKRINLKFNIDSQNLETLFN